MMPSRPAMGISVGQLKPYSLQMNSLKRDLQRALASSPAPSIAHDEGTGFKQCSCWFRAEEGNEPSSEDAPSFRPEVGLSSADQSPATLRRWSLIGKTKCSNHRELLGQEFRKNVWKDPEGRPDLRKPRGRIQMLVECRLVLFPAAFFGKRRGLAVAENASNVFLTSSAIIAVGR